MNIAPLHRHLFQMFANLLELRETELEALKTDINELKNHVKDAQQGKLDLDRIIISDNGWELMPEQPEIERNGEVKENVFEATSV